METPQWIYLLNHDHVLYNEEGMFTNQVPLGTINTQRQCSDESFDKNGKVMVNISSTLLNFPCRFIPVGTLSDCPNPIGWYLRISAGGPKGMFLSKGGSPLQAANCYSRVGPALPGVTWQSQQRWGHRRLEGVRYKLATFFLHRREGGGPGGVQDYRACPLETFSFSPQIWLAFEMRFGQKRARDARGGWDPSSFSFCSPTIETLGISQQIRLLRTVVQRGLERQTPCFGSQVLSSSKTFGRCSTKQLRPA